MIGAMVGALVIGILGMFSVTISQGIYSGQNTSGWPSLLTSTTGNIPSVIAVVAIIAILLVLVKVSGSNT